MNTETQITAHKNYPLADLSTLKIGGCADLAYFPSSPKEFIELRNRLKEEQIPITVIGAGSNLLISSQGVSGAVIFTKKIDFIEMTQDNLVKIGSGAKSVSVAKWAQQNSFTGFEFLVGIPGSIGGAITMNSSAHGQAIKDIIHSVEVLDLNTGEISVLNLEQLELDYRSSFIQHNKHIILNASFKLNKGEAKEITDLMDFHIQYRAKNHPPLTEPSAGSTFRNPEQGAYVGRMFEELGLKGIQEGGAKISEKHANFIVNVDNATSVDVSKLMHSMHSKVKEKYGYDLLAEIRFIGDMTKEEEDIWNCFQVH